MENFIKSYLSFRIGTEKFAVNVLNIQNIIEFKTVTQVPDMPSYVLGVVNLRGEILPVVDSRIKLRLPITEITSNTCIIVVEIKTNTYEKKMGLVVDEVSEVFEIQNSEIKAPPSIGIGSIEENTITGIIPENDKFIMLLDIFKILGCEEISNVA